MAIQTVTPDVAEQQTPAITTSIEPKNKFMVGSGYIDRDELADLLMINLPRIIDYSLTSKNPYEHINPIQAEKVNAISGLFIDGIRNGTFILKSNGMFNDKLGEIKNSNSGGFDPVSFIEKHLRNIIYKKYDLKQQSTITQTPTITTIKEEFKPNDNFYNYFINKIFNGTIPSQDMWNTWAGLKPLEKAKELGKLLEEYRDKEIQNSNYARYAGFGSKDDYINYLNHYIPILTDDTFDKTKEFTALSRLGIDPHKYFSNIVNDTTDAEPLKPQESTTTNSKSENDTKTSKTTKKEMQDKLKAAYDKYTSNLLIKKIKDIQIARIRASIQKSGGILNNRINEVKKLKFAKGGSSEETKRENNINKHNRENDKRRIDKRKHDETLIAKQAAHLKKIADNLYKQALSK